MQAIRPSKAGAHSTFLLSAYKALLDNYYNYNYFKEIGCLSTYLKQN